MNDHLRPRAKFALSGDRTTALADDRGHVGQPQSEATHVMSLPRSDTIEAVEDVLQIVLCHSDSIILDADTYAPFFVTGADS